MKLSEFREKTKNLSGNIEMSISSRTYTNHYSDYTDAESSNINLITDEQNYLELNIEDL